MINYIAQHWIEFLGTLISLAYIYFSVKENIFLWLFGFLGAVLYLIVYYDAKFYADMSLQIYYITVSIYGWIRWRKGNVATSNRDELPIRHIDRKEIFIFAIATSILFLGYRSVLIMWTDSPLPNADSFTTALSIVGTWLLTRKVLEQWILWVLIDAISVILYIYKGIYFTAFLFAVYTILAVVGYIQWRQKMNDKPTSQPSV